MKELLKKVNLELIKHQVIFRNDTSGTETVKESEVNLIEFKEKGIVLEVPQSSCQQNHNLSLFFIKLPVEKVLKTFKEAKTIKGAFEFTGKIIEYDFDKETDMATIDVFFGQFDEKLWTAFITSYIEKQNQVNEYQQDF